MNRMISPTSSDINRSEVWLKFETLVFAAKLAFQLWKVVHGFCYNPATGAHGCRICAVSASNGTCLQTSAYMLEVVREATPYSTTWKSIAAQECVPSLHLGIARSPSAKACLSMRKLLHNSTLRRSLFLTLFFFLSLSLYGPICRVPTRGNPHSDVGI